MQFVQLPNFDVATDAFSSFRDLMTKHKTKQFAEWIERSYERVPARPTVSLPARPPCRLRQLISPAVARCAAVPRGAAARFVPRGCGLMHPGGHNARR